MQEQSSLDKEVFLQNQCQVLRAKEPASSKNSPSEKKPDGKHEHFPTYYSGGVLFRSGKGD